MPYFEIYMPNTDRPERRQWRNRNGWWFMDWTHVNPTPTCGRPSPESFSPRADEDHGRYHVVSYEELLALIAQTRAALALRQ